MFHCFAFPRVWVYESGFFEADAGGAMSWMGYSGLDACGIDSGGCRGHWNMGGFDSVPVLGLLSLSVKSRVCVSWMSIYAMHNPTSIVSR